MAFSAGLGFDIDSVIEKDAEAKRRRAEEHQELTLKDYLALLEEDPLLSQSSPARLLEAFDHEGSEDIPEEEQLFGATKRYNLISKKLFGSGVDQAVEYTVKYLRAGANRLSTGKQVLLLVGPTASGKSTFANILKRALENYKLRSVYCIKNCPMHEDPLHALPRKIRRLSFDEDGARELGLEQPIEDQLGIPTIEGDLCHYCRSTLIGWTDGQGEKHAGTHVDEESGVFEWWNVPVETFTFSLQGGRGLGSFEPSDEKSQDVGELVGHENIGITANPKYGRDHPEAFRLDGELEKGNRGITEGREFLKKGIDERILWTFINVAEEKEVKVPNSSFPHISVDTVTIGHCNLTGYKAFAADSAHEALHDRIYVIPLPYPLRVQDEVAVYRKLIEKESNLTALQDCHIAPGSLELAAAFATLTRLKESDMGVDLITKMKAYNGERVLTELEDEDKNPIDLQSLIEEGQQDDDIAKREGMFGVSSRDVLAALNIALVEQMEKGEGACLTPLTAIRALKNVVDHRMGYSPEQIDAFMELLSAEEGGSVVAEYKEFVVQQVSRAFLRAYDDLARDVFNRYVQEAEYDRSRKRKYMRSGSAAIKRDEVTEKVKEPDEKLMRSVEEHIPVSESEKDTFRGEMLEYRSANPDFDYETYEPLRRAVEKKLLEGARSSLTLVLATDKPKDEQDKKRAKELFDTLKEQGFCKTCAKETVEKTAEIINE